jgi:hypothetical protein
METFIFYFMCNLFYPPPLFAIEPHLNANRLPVCGTEKEFLIER